MLKTSREVFDDPIDRDRYCFEEYRLIDTLNTPDPEREKHWRRWCWYLASLDGFPESYTCHTGEIVADRNAASIPRDAWTSFCQRASIHDLADAIKNRHEFSRNWRDPKSRMESAA